MKKGRYEEALAIARNLIAEGIAFQAVQKLTGLPEKEVMELVDKH